MRRRLGEARVGRLATTTVDGRPHAVPCCFVLDAALDGDVVWTAVDAKPKRTSALRRLENVRAHPHAALLVDHYDDDWSTLWWVRVDGTARVVEGGPERGRAVALLTGKYEQYEHTPPPGPVIAVTVERWAAWP